YRVGHHRRGRRQGRADHREPARQHRTSYSEDLHDLDQRSCNRRRRPAARRRRRAGHRTRTHRGAVRTVPAGAGRSPTLAGRGGRTDARAAVRGAARRPGVGRGARGRRRFVPGVPPGAAGWITGTLDGLPGGHDRVIDGSRPHLRRPARRTETRDRVGEPLRVDRGELLPLAREVVLEEDRGHGAHRLARAAVDAFVRLDVQHARAFVDAIHRTLVHAGAVLHVDARLADRVGHRLPLFTFSTVWTGEILPRGTPE